MDPDAAQQAGIAAAADNNENHDGSVVVTAPSDNPNDHAITATTSSKSGQEDTPQQADEAVTESQNHQDAVAEAILQADETLELKAVEELENAYMDVDVPLNVEPTASAQDKEAAHIQAEGMADATTMDSQLPHSPSDAVPASANGGETREVKVEKMEESLGIAGTASEDAEIHTTSAPLEAPAPSTENATTPFPSVEEAEPEHEHELEQEAQADQPPPALRSVAGSISTLSTVDEGPANDSATGQVGQATATSATSRSAPASTRAQRKSVTRGSSTAAKDESSAPLPPSKRSSGRTTSEKPVSSSSTTTSRTRASAAAVAAAAASSSSSSSATATRSSGRASSNKPVSKDDNKATNSRARVRKQSGNMSLRTTRGSASGRSGVDASNEMDLSTYINEDPELEEVEHEPENDGDEGITRCVCGSTDDDAPEFMIQCETCRVWQHGPCVGFQVESACPDTYYCEQCRPDLHPTLNKRKKHGRSASSSSKAGLTGASERETSGKPVSRDQAHHRETSHPTPTLPHSASFGSSSSAAPAHRSRASVDASAIVNEHKKGSPSPAATAARSPSHGSESPGPMSADGKRPMYPSTSHLSGPLQPKRRSTMNSRESAAFDESLMLANANAIKESRAMAMGITGAPGSASPSSAAFPYGASGASGDALHASRGRKRRRKEDSSEREESEDNAAGTAAANQSTSTTHSGKEGMDVVKEEDENVEEDYTGTGQGHTGLAAVKDTIEAYKEEEAGQNVEESKIPVQGGHEHVEEETPQEAEGIEEVQEVYDEAGDESLSLAQPAKKRRKRRGIGMTATARTKKAALAAKARQQLQAIKVDEDHLIQEGGGLESDAVPDTPVETDEQNQRKRKRMDGGEEEIPARAASPTASTATTETTTSSDKPLASSKKSRPSPPSHPTIGNGSDIIVSEPADGHQLQNMPLDASASQASLRLEPLQVNNLAIMSDLPASNAPSPTGSTSTTTTGLNGQGKESQNGMLFPPSINGRKRPGPKPASQVEETEEDADSASGSVAPFSKGRSGAGRGRGGGPGSRGGKGSPNKRGGHAHAAAEAARKGFRGDTPNTDDFYHQPPTWGIPDHLSHLSHLLPSPAPLPLQVPAYIRSPAPSAAPSPIENANPATVSTAEASTSGSSSNGATSVAVEPVTVSQAEAPTKIRFPPRRMSAAEMRKRSKNILDYLAYCQIETVDRNSRTAALGLQNHQSSGPNTPSRPKGQESPTPQSMLMMDDLSRQLMSFQERFL